MDKPWPLVRPQKDIKISASGQAGGVLGVGIGWVESLQMEQMEFAHTIISRSAFIQSLNQYLLMPCVPGTPQSSPSHELPLDWYVFEGTPVKPGEEWQE